MAIIIDWINGNEGFVSALLAVVTSFLSIYAIYVSRSSLRQTRKQGKLDEGLTLYPLRRDILRLYSEAKYDELFWDAEVLFSDSIVSDISRVAKLYNDHQSYLNKIDLFESRLQNDLPELYERYIACITDNSVINDFNMEPVYSLLGEYRPIVQMPDGATEILDYQDITKNEILNRRKYEIDHLKLFIKMKNEIRQSLKS